ncbi:MAG: hypothetical protein CMH64_02820 [Nanoarchaeota archaeon]|nr:hypothetical protein [Nanoarchaeota archaeon]MAF51002.1 hypothetical protein [Nanoarchaeota archaeon]|tara:strand:- start:186 stop:764 length:579 start_codon:yes stop_codon:yes gene_type:complete
MEMKDIIEGLKKARNKEKFIRDLIEKTKDKKLKELLKQLLEKKKSYGSSKLEKLVTKENVELEPEEPKLTVQLPEPEVELDIPNQEATPIQGQDVDYTSNKSGSVNYTTGSTHQQLEQSNQIASGGHIGNAETQGLIDSKMGSYHMSKDNDKYQEDNVEYQTKRDSFVDKTAFDDTLGVDRDKKKKRLGDYI